jgi:putative restriction endonuclease
MSRQNWSRAELLAAFNLYCRTPFGRLHAGNSDIIQLAAAIVRTPNAVAMKLVNFASLDPVQQARGIKGLVRVSHADRALFEEFRAAPETVAVESEESFERLLPASADAEKIVSVEPEDALAFPQGETEVSRVVRVRRVQGFFRRVVLSSYSYQCALCGLDIGELLVASHIIPWRQDVQRRADPRNGLSLCAMHDRAFDQGLIAFDHSLGLLLSEKVKSAKANVVSQSTLIDWAGRTLTLPSRFAPDSVALQWHREHIFKN